MGCGCFVLKHTSGGWTQQFKWECCERGFVLTDMGEGILQEPWWIWDGRNDKGICEDWKPAGKVVYVLGRCPRHPPTHRQTI